MADSHIEKRVREIIADQLGIADEDISPQSSFHHDLGADSTVADIIRYIERQPN